MSTTQSADAVITLTSPIPPAAPEADSPPTPLLAAWRTHVGHKRDNNEDSVLFDATRRLFAVADGLGGRPAGELASALTIQTLKNHVHPTDGDPHRVASAITGAICLANDAVLGQADADEERTGMGSTVVACHVMPSGAAIVAHSGDSRAYLFRHGDLGRVTLDHVRIRANRRLLSRCVGRTRGADPDVTQLVTEPGDRLLLCTDGLTDMLADDVIGWLLLEPEPDAAADALVDAALRAGGHDNVTVVVIDRCSPDDEVAES